MQKRYFFRPRNQCEKHPQDLIPNKISKESKVAKYPDKSASVENSLIPQSKFDPPSTSRENFTPPAPKNTN